MQSRITFNTKLKIALEHSLKLTTLGARGFSSAVYGSVKSSPHARKTSGTQGKN